MRCAVMPKTLGSAYNYAATLNDLGRFEEAKSLLSRTLPVARRVLREGFDLTLRIRKIYAVTLYKDAGATLDELRESVTTLEDTERIRRRVFGGSHPTTSSVENSLREARTVLGAREAGKSVVFRQPPNAAVPGSA